MAGVLEYALRLKTAGFDGPLKQSQANLKSFSGNPMAMTEVQLGKLESSAVKTTASLKEIGDEAVISGNKIDTFKVKTSNAQLAMNGLGTALQAVPGIALIGGFALTAVAGITAFAGAVVLSNAALRESGTDEAAAALGRFDKSVGVAKSQLSGLAAEFKKTALELAEPIALKISSVGTQVINQLAKDLGFIRELAGLGDTSKAAPSNNRNAQANKEAADKEAAAEAAAAAERTVATANEAFWQGKADERAEAEKKQAEERVKTEAAAQKEILASQEKVFTARLSEAANLERQIAALKSAGPSGAAAINGAKDLTVKAALAERTAELVTLEKRLAEVQAATAGKAESTTKAAEAKADAADKEYAAQSKAAGLFEAEGALLEAKANKQAKLVATLERQAAVEALKLDLMDKQGLSAESAAAAAEKRISLEERVANTQRRGLLDAAASAAARLVRRSAADKGKDERRGGTGSNTDRLALADLERRQSRPLSPAAAAAQLARGSSGADPGKSRREERAQAKEKAENPLLAAVNEIKAQLATLTTA